MATIDSELVVKFIAVHMERESRFLSPDPIVYMHDPYRLLKLIEQAGATPTEIDQWMQEAQEDDHAHD